MTVDGHLGWKTREQFAFHFNGDISFDRLIVPSYAFNSKAILLACIETAVAVMVSMIYDRAESSDRVPSLGPFLEECDLQLFTSYTNPNYEGVRNHPSFEVLVLGPPEEVTEANTSDYPEAPDWLRKPI